jgi:hypothetical protein
MEKNYFIAYMFTMQDGRTGMGNTFFKSNVFISEESHIRDMEKQMIEVENYKYCTIINYKLLREEQDNG